MPLERTYFLRANITQQASFIHFGGQSFNIIDVETPDMTPSSIYRYDPLHRLGCNQLYGH